MTLMAHTLRQPATCHVPFQSHTVVLCEFVRFILTLIRKVHFNPHLIRLCVQISQRDPEFFDWWQMHCDAVLFPTLFICIGN
jgi:hypothetical protein